MHTKWIVAAVVACLLLGFAAGSITWTPTAQGQAPAKGQAWEYKVVVFDTNAEAKSVDQAFNELGGQGWEYAGVLHQVEQRRESTAVFKRVKR